MRLICNDETCDTSCADYEAGGPYMAPTCPSCDGPMHAFDEPVIESMSGTARRWTGGDVEFMAALPDTTPAEQYAIPAGALLRRQAGGR